MNSPGPKAQSVNEIASAWLERFHAGNWTEQNQEDLDAWLAESSAHRAAYWRLEDAWSNASRLSALRQPVRQPVAQRRILPILARTAAVIAVVGAAGIFAARYFGSPESQTYVTGLGGRETLALSDGSRIELNTNTVLRVATNARSRTVWLDKGEAYFEIKHDSAHPFVVFTTGHRITDLGTKFLVRQNKDRVEVALIEGKARVDSSDVAKAQSAVLTPGDVAIATTDKLSVTQRPNTKLTNELSWRQGQLIFSETTLADAVAQFNRYNITKLVVSDPTAARMKINGTFPTNGTEMFARVTQHILQLRTEKHGDEIVISR
jgi:transmembrane sensor